MRIRQETRKTLAQIAQFGDAVSVADMLLALGGHSNSMRNTLNRYESAGLLVASWHRSATPYTRKVPSQRMCMVKYYQLTPAGLAIVQNSPRSNALTPPLPSVANSVFSLGTLSL
jgi:hypothetical protein